MNTQPKVSIMIPVYKTAQYLPKCFDSVLNQTLKDIEIIVVNDASPDNAAQILNEYALKDERIKIVTHKENRGILAARISGLRVATGEFIICLDADDTLNRDIARAAYKKAKKTGADIVHFRFDTRMENGKKTAFAKSVDKPYPYKNALLGKAVFESAFVDRLYRWNIVGKMISTEVFRKAADALPPGYYIMAEDFCFYSLMSFFAKHYEPLQMRGYNYVLNVGVSAYKASDRAGFVRTCSAFTALNAVHTFLEKNNVFEKYREAFDRQENALIGDLTDRWLHRTIPDDKKYCLNYMLENYNPISVLAGMANYLSTDIDAQCAIMHLPEAYFAVERSQHKGITNLGIYIDDTMTDSAVQLASFVEKLNNSGIRTCIITHETLGAPALSTSDAAVRSKRIRQWNKIIQERQFDTILYLEPDGQPAYWDMLAIRASGASLLVVPNSNFYSMATSRSAGFAARANVLRFADEIVCLSEAECNFHRMRGVRAALLPVNPIQICPAPQKDNVVWLGDGSDMNALLTSVSVFGKITADLPKTAKLILCSPPMPTEAQRYLNLLLEAFGLQERCEFCHFNHIEQVLPTASIVLLENDYSEIAHHIIYFSGVKIMPCNSSCDEIVAAIQEKKFKEINVGSRSLKNVIDTLKEPAPPIQEGVEIFEKTLFPLYNNALCYERYAIEPPTQGDSFFSFYKTFDNKIGKFLKPGSKTRHYVFAGIRKIMKKIIK